MTPLQTAAVFVTDFADQAVILPAAVLVALGLALAGWRRGALAWSIAVAGTLAVVLILKVGFGACGHLMSGAAIESPSGHTAAAGVVYGSILAFLVERAFGRTALTMAVIFAVVCAVGLSRVVLGAHSFAEVGVGGAVGFAAALAALLGAGEPTVKQSRLGLLLLPLLILVIWLHGLRLPAEAAIHRLEWDGWPFSACR